MTNYLCGPRLYKYENWFFEWKNYCGPWPLKKDGELRKRAGNKFYDMFSRFQGLSKVEQERYRVGGGCVAF